MGTRHRLEALLGLVTEVLDTLVLERLPTGFRRLGNAPPWVRACSPDTDAVLPPLPFLEEFVADADAFWAEGRDGAVRSGVWTERRGATSLHLTASALRFGSLRLLLVIRDEAAFRDHLRLAQLGRDAVRAHDRLVRETERKEILVHMVVHDLAVPVNAVLGCLALLEEQALPAGARRLVELAHRAALRHDQLVHEVLDTFVAEQDAMGRVERDPARAPQALEAVKRVLALLEPASARFGVHLVADGARGTEQARVAADPSRLDRILANLVENAVRHSPAGATVRVAVSPGPSDVLFSVLDDGPGVPAEQEGSLFQKFQQGDTRGRAGLGLYFCAMTVHRWGGTIGYLPRSGGGACFWFRLSRVDVDAAQRPEPLVDALDEPVGELVLGHRAFDAELPPDR